MKFFLRLLVLGLLLFSGHLHAAGKPNVIIILADDVGYSDLGCMGSEIATPNLDALASGGLRFTQFYNTARCCPTRASLLTGLYPHQAGIGHMMDDKGSDAYRGDLNRRSVTLAEALKPAGYRNYAVGKWHVTPGATAAQLTNRKNWPTQRGFDRYYGTIHGAGSFWDPSSLVRDNKIVTPVSDPDYRPEEYYYTDALSDHASRFIREHARDHAGTPFLLYVAYTAAHWPMHARESDIAKYKGRYDVGYAAIRAARWEKQKKLGVADAKWGIAPLAGEWEKVANKEFEARCMEVYAAMLDSMDQGIGRIVAELKAAGQFDNTLICYLQDNGGNAETNGRAGAFIPRAAQPSLPPMAKDAQQFGSKPDQTRDGWPVRQGYGVLPGPADTFIAYGGAWGNVSNTPFREYKHWVHEGGISTPLIAHWPAGILAARRGRLEAQPGHLIDLMATCVDLAGATYPENFHGERITPLEGVSLRPAFAGKSLRRVRPIFWEHEGNRAIRIGEWKLVSKHPGGWELFDVEADRSESTDLATRHPARVKDMAAQWETWATRVGVRPWPLSDDGAAPSGPAAKKKK
ncbi:MAG: arylsulfatase [Opitutus sp.]|nr:arylsulfatase [Opitutus sp.]